MGYENGLGNGLPDAPEISLPGGGGEWEGEGGTIDPKHAEQAGKAVYALWQQYKPIKWDAESGMKAVTRTQNTVVVPVKITKKPRGSFFNTKYGTIQPGEVVVEVARGSVSGVPNSYVEWGGISGWVRTGELKNVEGVYLQRKRTASYEPASYDFDYSQAGSSPYSAGPDAAQPATQLPVLPLAAIGYFLLNR